jgi:putative ABC transport system permease protein
MYLLKMAWRNLGRRRSRTLLSLLSIAVGVFVVITAKGFIEGIYDTMLDYSVNFNSGHVRLIRPEYEAKERVLSSSPACFGVGTRAGFPSPAGGSSSWAPG